MKNRTGTESKRSSKREQRWKEVGIGVEIEKKVRYSGAEGGGKGGGRENGGRGKAERGK